MGSVAVASLSALQALLRSANDRLVVVDVGASWCGPCRMIAPHFEALAAEFGASAVFCKVDGDQARDVCSHLGVEGFPTFVFLRQGVEVDRLVGADAEGLTRRVRQLSVKPEPVSSFSFPPRQFAIVAAGGSLAGVAAYLAKQCPEQAAGLMAAVQGKASDEEAAVALAREPGVLCKTLCSLLATLPEECKFGVVDVVRKLLAVEGGAAALALMNGTAVAVLPQVLQFAAEPVSAASSAKHLQNRHALAWEAISNGLAQDRLRAFCLSVPLPDVSAVVGWPERSQIALATVLFNTAVIAWRTRDEAVQASCAAQLLSLLSSADVKWPAAAAVRLLGAVGTLVFLVHAVNSRPDRRQWDCEPATLLSSLDLEPLESLSPSVKLVVGELRQALQLPLESLQQ